MPRPKRNQKRRSTVPKKSVHRSTRARIRKLTPSGEESLRYAREHPIPPQFWEGEDNPGKPDEG